MKSERNLVRIGALLVVALICLVLLIGLVVTVLRPGENDSDAIQREISPLSRSGSIQELTDINRFRSAYIASNGGLSGIDRLNSLLVAGTFESGGQTVPFRSVKKRPDQGITTLEMPDYTLSFVVSGSQVWQRVEQPGQAPVDSLLTGKEADALVDLGYFFDPIMHVLLYEASAIQSITIDEWAGQPSLRMEFASSIRKTKGEVYFSPDTLTPIARIERFTDGHVRRILYEDYRRIDGAIQQPHQIETYMDEELLNRVRIDRILANPGIGSFIFEYTGSPKAEATPAP